MKITQETNEFKPITIVLETLEEANAFHRIFSTPPFHELVYGQEVLDSMYLIEENLRDMLK